MNEKDNQGTDYEIQNISILYKNWYLDYASYVILERAIPNLKDGLKPVQRRILHAMKEMDDGRFNKVANIVGQSMQYHPHGDASISDAIVKLGQKDLLIETQGNWGDIRTGDGAAASRYIEARLSGFSLEVLFSHKITEWGMSYDGRKKEPLYLPVKFPLLLVQGVVGIAVGFATEILPHNFCEVIHAAIKYLKNKPFELYPDFQTGGIIDIQNYKDGLRGGKIVCRARIEEIDKKTLCVRDLPYSITTTQLCESIVKANENGAIKIKKVTDNTAENVEIIIELAPNISSDITIQALYAFTDCQISITPSVCVIERGRPVFMSISDVLKISVDNSKNILKKELDVYLEELEDDWHYSSLEKIFIENKIYRNIEDQITWDNVLKSIDVGLKPFASKLKRQITEEDIIKLTEIKIKKISRFDVKNSEDQIKEISNSIEKVKKSIRDITTYTIDFYEKILKKYGKGRERKTEIKRLDNIEAREVVLANTKIYVNKKDGFVGTSLKSDEFVCVCSTLDDIIVFRKDGKFVVKRVSDKVFVGKDIIYVDVFRKNDKRTTYHVVYLDGETSKNFIKRFFVYGITRDKEYSVINENKNSKLHYFSVHKNGEEEVVEIILSPNCNAQKKHFIYNFKELGIKNRSVLGNQLTRYPIRAVKQKYVGQSTLGGVDIWYNYEFGKLTNQEDSNSFFIENMNLDDNILVVYKDGTYEIINQDLTQRIEAEKVILIEKFIPKTVLTLAYKDLSKGMFMVKRFAIETQAIKTKFTCIKEGDGNEIVLASTKEKNRIKVTVKKKSDVKIFYHNVESTTEISTLRSVGNKLVELDYTNIEWCE